MTMELDVTDIGNRNIIFSCREAEKLKITLIVSDLVISGIGDRDIATGEAVTGDGVENISFYCRGLGEGLEQKKQKETSEAVLFCAHNSELNALQMCGYSFHSTMRKPRDKHKTTLR